MSFEIRHQSGEKMLHADTEQAAYSTAAGVDGIVSNPSSHDMAEAYAWADVVIARAGALTVRRIMRRRRRQAS